MTHGSGRGKLEKLRQKLLARPVEMPLADVRQVLKAAGWSMREGKGSHVVFIKPDTPPIPMRVEDRKVNRAAVNDAARAIGHSVE